MGVLASATVWVAAVVAFLAGMAWQAAVTALQNLRKTKESLPGLRETRRDALRTAVQRFVLAIAVATALTIMLMGVD
jgi:hypothetical protein